VMKLGQWNAVADHRLAEHFVAVMDAMRLAHPPCPLASRGSGHGRDALGAFALCSPLPPQTLAGTLS
jgi:hypothetical protein